MAITCPRGTRDLLPGEAVFWQNFKETASRVFGLYGYVPIETPIIEQTELFVRGIGEATDVVSKEMFTAICRRCSTAASLSLGAGCRFGPRAPPAWCAPRCSMDSFPRAHRRSS